MATFRQTETEEERFIRYADVITANSTYDGELNHECLDPFADIWGDNCLPELPSELLEIRNEVLLLQPKNDDGEQVTIDITKQYFADVYSGVKNHLLQYGYINKPDHTYRWILTEKEGMPMKESGGHYPYQLRKQAKINLEWYQTENAKRQFEDYPKLDRRAKSASTKSTISICLSILIPMLLLLLKWKCHLPN